MTIVVITDDPRTSVEIARLVRERGREPYVLESVDEPLPAGPVELAVTAGLDVADVKKLAASLALTPDGPPAVLIAIAPDGVAPEALLGAGADDCLSGPLDVEALRLRLAVAERRSNSAAPNPGEQKAFLSRMLSEAARVAAIVDSSTDAIVSRDLDLKIVSWNAAAERVYGYTAEEAMGQGPEFLVPQSGETGMAACMARVLAGERLVFEDHRVRQDGAVILAHHTMFPLHEPAGGHIAGMACITRDITEQKTTQEAISRSLRDQQALARLRDAVSAAEASQQIVDAAMDTLADLFAPDRLAVRAVDSMFSPNAGYAGTRGLSSRYQEAMGKVQYWDRGDGFLVPIVIEDVRTGPLPEDMRAAIIEEGVGSLVNVSLMAAGRLLGSLNIYYNAPRAFDPADVRLMELVGSHVALAMDRFLVQRALVESQEMLSLTFDSAGIGLVVADADARVVQVNDAFLAMSGYDRAEIAGEPFTVMMPERVRENVLARYGRLISGGITPTATELPGRRKDGSEYYVAASTARFTRDGQPYTVSSFADVTARREAQDLAERLGSILANSPNETFLFDAETLRFVDANEAALAHLGYSMDELRELRPTDVVVGWTGEEFQEFSRPLVTGEVEQVRFEHEQRRKDGSTYPAEGRLLLSTAESASLFLTIVEDVTDRKRMEDALREQETYLTRITENAPIILSAIDKDGIFRHSSGAGLSKLGRTPGQTIGKSFFDLYAGREDLIASCRQALQGEEFTAEAELDGAIWETHYTPVRGSAGEPNGFIAVAVEITTRRTAEAALRASEAYLHSVVDNAPLILLALDSNGIFTHSGGGGLARIGKLPGASVGQSIFDVYADNPDVLDAVRRTLAGETVIIETMVAGVPWEAHYRPFIKDGAPDGLIGVITDLTERRAAESALRESEAQLRAIHESSADGMMLVDRDGTMLAANPAAHRLALVTHGEPVAIGAPAERYASDLEDWRARFANALNGEPSARELTYATEDDTQITVEVRFFPILDGPGSVERVVVVVRDISEQKRTEQALLQAQKLESLGVLAGGIAHDFNNLLVGILGNAGLALMELPNGSPLRDTVLDIETAGQRAADLSRQMLAYSGRGRFVIQSLNLNSVVREMTHLLHSSIGKNIRLNYQLAETLALVDADATQIRQVVMNLVVNASDAIGADDGTISVTTSVVHATPAYLLDAYLAPDLPEGEYVHLEVTDTGCGMDTTTLNRIFDPFFTTKFTGRGLGLAAVLGIVRGHRGALKVTSEPGRGTTFRLLLPVARAAAPGQVIGMSADAQPQPWTGSGRLLVVDDEPVVRTVTVRALRLFGFDVAEAVDGQDAVEQVEKDPAGFVCVLLDLTMPRLNGEETQARLMQINPALPVVLMSGFNEQDAAERLQGRGVAAFIQKPFELATLRETLRAVIEAK